MNSAFKHSFLLLFLFTTIKVGAQSVSIFSKQTVQFVYFENSDRYKLRQILTGDEKYHDTLYTRNIFIDSLNQVHWVTNYEKGESKNYSIELYYTAIGDSNESRKDFTDKYPESNSYELPVFKTLIEGNRICYKTVGDKPKVFFSLSLSKNEHVDSLPFFMDATILSYNMLLEQAWYKFTYDCDTTILVKGNKVNCYCFKSRVTDITTDLQSYDLTLVEVYFEKASLLPVLIVKRKGQRFYANRLDDGKAGYFSDFETKYIQVR